MSAIQVCALGDTALFNLQAEELNKRHTRFVRAAAKTRMRRPITAQRRSTEP